MEPKVCYSRTKNCLPKKWLLSKTQRKKKWFLVQDLLNIMKNDEESRCIIIISKWRLAMPGIVVDWTVKRSTMVTASILTKQNGNNNNKNENLKPIDNEATFWRPIYLFIIIVLYFSFFPLYYGCVHPQHTSVQCRFQ